MLWRHGMVNRELSMFVAICARITACVGSDLMVCHDDFDLNPPDGILEESIFTWLGFVHYIHVTTGQPHLRHAPRVVLIQKQFVIGTAKEMLRLPPNYKIGDVVFGDYEREEEDCGITQSQIRMGVKCARAYIEMPIDKITPHPEYLRFGVGNSLALVKLIRPLKSNYMIPICLPSIGDRERMRKKKTVFMVDYISTVPRNLETEKMGKKTLKLYTHRECSRHRRRSSLGNEGLTHVLCSSGCGMRHGAPIVSHTLDGMFEVVGLAAGGAQCSSHSMRRRFNIDPPLYIDIFPYVSWITNVIAAHMIPLAYPQNLRRTDSDGFSRKGLPRSDYMRRQGKQRAGWKGRMFVTGNWCYKPEKVQRTAVLFYHETFEATASPQARLRLIMKISAGFETKIVCARLMLPNRLSEPVIDGVGGFNITVRFTTQWFPHVFVFHLGLTGKKSTAEEYYNWKRQRPPGFWSD